jgi:hypothetical protein
MVRATGATYSGYVALRTAHDVGGTPYADWLWEP